MPRRPVLTAQGVSRRLAAAGHQRSHRDGSMFAGVTPGYTVTAQDDGRRGAVRVEAVVTTSIRPAELRDRRLGQYAATLEAAGFTVARVGGGLAVTQEVPDAD